MKGMLTLLAGWKSNPESTGTFRTLRGPIQLAGLVAILAICAPPSAAAQGIKSLLESVGGSGAKAQSAPIPAQVAWANEQIEAAKAEEANEPALVERIKASGLAEARLEDFRAATREVQRHYRSAITIMEEFASMDSASESPTIAPPKSEEEAVAMRDDLRHTEFDRESALGERELIERLVSQNEALETNAERAARQFHEEAATAENPEIKARAQLRLELSSLQSRAAAAAAFFGKWKLAQQEIVLQKTTARQDALRTALRTGGFDRQLDPRRAELQLAKLTEEETALDKATEALKKNYSRFADAAAALREKATTPVEKGRAAAADGLAETAQRLLSALQAQGFLIADEKAHWNGVHALATGEDAGELRSTMAQAEEIIARQNDLRPSVDRRLAEARDSLLLVQRNLQEGVKDPITKETMEETVAYAQRRLETLGNLMAKSRQIVTTEEEFLAEVRTTLGKESTARRVTRTWEHVTSTIHRIWSFEIFPGEGIHITIGKVVLALGGLVLAFLLAGWLARWTSHTATRRFQLVEEQKSLLERSVFIPLTAILALTVLHWLSIPLTVFAFLGGALAIGIGFGAQNLVNNFISGVILLLERQIRVGDIIEVAGSTGKVMHLGSRCSRIRKFDGVELLVPNSSFLEKEVTNWTLADPQHRFDFVIGVAYGSPVDKVISLLLSAIERQPEVLRNPEPGVYFEAFGDSSLNFRVYYWLELGGSLNALQVGSELRTRIDRDFRAADIEIPFPQRDLRVRGVLPVSIEQTNPTEK